MVSKVREKSSNTSALPVSCDSNILSTTSMKAVVAPLFFLNRDWRFESSPFVSRTVWHFCNYRAQVVKAHWIRITYGKVISPKSKYVRIRLLINRDKYHWDQVKTGFPLLGKVEHPTPCSSCEGYHRVHTRTSVYKILYFS